MAFTSDSDMPPDSLLPCFRTLCADPELFVDMEPRTPLWSLSARDALGAEGSMLAYELSPHAQLEAI